MLVRRHGQAHSQKKFGLKAKLCLFNIEHVMRPISLRRVPKGASARSGYCSKTALVICSACRGLGFEAMP